MTLTFRKAQADPDPDEFPLMDAKEAASKLGISVKNLMAHVDAGRIRYINMGTAKRRQLRFTPKNLRSFIENRKTREAPACPSTSQTKPPTINSASKPAASGFMALPKPPTKKTLKLLKSG